MRRSWLGHRPAGEVVGDIRRMDGEAVANGDDVAHRNGAGRLIQTACCATGCSST